MELIANAAAPVPGFEGLYTITKNGVVYSLPRKGRKLRVLKPVDNMKAGYLRAKLSGNGLSKLFYIHQLVAMAYIPNPENKRFVNHIDGVKTNNRLENLEWVTAQENRDHAFRLGLYTRQKICSAQKVEVYELVKQGVPIKEVAKMYGMSSSGIYHVIERYNGPELQIAA
jgi:hypothetical protein